jgi:hypothetical protein
MKTFKTILALTAATVIASSSAFAGGSQSAPSKYPAKTTHTQKAKAPAPVVSHHNVKWK